MSPTFVRFAFLLALIVAIERCDGRAAVDERPDPEPSPLPVAVTTTTEAQAELVEVTTGRPQSEVEALTEVVTTTTTTEATTTTTTEAATTTTTASVAGMDLGAGGLLSNAITGGGSNGGGLLSLLGGSATKPKEKGPQGNFDKHLDAIIGNLGKAIRANGFDPIKLGSLLQCRNCSMEGLSLIRRVGPSNLMYANRTLNVDAFLGLPALYISCFPCVEYVLSVPFTGMLEVALWDVQFYGKVSQKTTRGANPSLDEYKVIREGDLDISLNGYGLLGPFTEVGFKLIHQRMVSNMIREYIYDKVPNFIASKLKEFSFPIGKR